jgi:hypothetical protein
MSFSQRPRNERPPTALRRVDKSHALHTGLKVVVEETHRAWRILVEHRRVGLTLPRDQFSVRIRDESESQEEYLTGFSTKLSAIEAARKRIDFIVDIRRPRTARRYHWRRA